MTAIMKFQFENTAVRSVILNDNPWWVAADVCSALEHSDTSMAVRRLDEDERGTSIIRTPSGDQEMLIINESGLYSLILTSRKPAAKRFKKWVTAEVLPAIRQTGRYEPQPSEPALDPSKSVIDKDRYIQLLEMENAILKGEGLKKRSWNPMTEAELQEVHRLHGIGFTHNEIARRLKRDAGTILYHLKIKGVGNA